MTKAYKKYHDVYTALERYCDNLRLHSRGRTLPSTRTLATELDTNRVTLSKAIELAEMNGLITRSIHGLQINNTLEIYQGKIVFLTTGFGDAPSLGAWCRLWNALHLHAAKTEMKLSLCLTNDQISIQNVLECCANADLVIFTIGIVKEDLSAEAIIQALNNEGVNVICMTEIQMDCNYICINNKAIGIDAAQALMHAGCQKPAVIYKGDINAYFRRKEGFCAYMAEHQIPVLTFNADDEPQMDLYGYFQTSLDQSVLQGCDGAFIVSDEGIAHITFNVFQRKLVPERMKLITVHGSGEALVCAPPVACISHGTQAVLNTLLEHLSEVQKNGGTFLPIHQYIEPVINITQSLSKDLRIFPTNPRYKIVFGSL